MARDREVVPVFVDLGDENAPTIIVEEAVAEEATVERPKAEDELKRWRDADWSLTWGN